MTPILAPKKSTDWNTEIEALGLTVNSHTMRISVSREKIEALQQALQTEWPSTRRSATAREILSLVGKLWNITYALRPGKYFVWRTILLAGLHDPKAHDNQHRMLGIGHEFHADLNFWKWAIETKLL